MVPSNAYELLDEFEVKHSAKRREKRYLVRDNHKEAKVTDCCGSIVQARPGCLPLLQHASVPYLASVLTKRNQLSDF